ncbi:PREDICTED: accelerated cell death 11 [Theobroma cacao]|uniref:Accelerated cell death 11 n=2 Tax=Theobroma cacao TaxID=3641 RepID=A0AB32VHN4_THECC|nr:PREDICTED: accelerated cell death 11 [Theobroma cacao]
MPRSFGVLVQQRTFPSLILTRHRQKNLTSDRQRERERERSTMVDLENEKTLRKISDAFKELAATVNSQAADMDVAPFSRACSLVSPLFGCLGIAFKFAEMDYVAKVDDLAEASKSIATLNAMLDRDVEGNCVRKAGSHTRNLLRVKRGLDMVRVLFEQILVTEGNSLKDPASRAYAQVFAPHHGWAIRKAVAAGMYALPTRAQLLKKLNEDEASARIQMQNYVTASGPIILYIDQLFLSRELGTDW